MTSRERTPFEDTSVSVSKSQDQIRKLLRDAGAEGVQFSEEWTDPPAFYVRFIWRMTPPDADAQGVLQAVRLKVNPLGESHKGVVKTHEQRERQAWRGIAHYLEGTIKAATFGLQHSFQVLTKRPEVALAWARDEWCDRLPENVWIGVSIENARFTWRADVLRQIPAAVRFISAEPLLGSLFKSAAPSVQSVLEPAQPGEASGVGNGPDAGAAERRRAPLDLTAISWLIAGGESGPGYRPMQIEHARELRDACAANGVAFFFKQHGGQTPKSGGKTLDGREWCDYPVAA